MNGILMDAHCHLHEYGENEIGLIMDLNIYIVAVSDDYRSSIRTIEISKMHSLVVPAVGLHPWNVGPDYEDEMRNIEKLLLENRLIKVLGEVGLDRKFKPYTLQYQDVVFRRFAEIAREKNFALNIHAADAWRDVLDILYRNDVPLAILHWYTGPQELVREIADRGYYITVNPALSIQQRHRDIVKIAPLDIILIESDAPYRYRGLTFHPREIFNVLKYIAELKGLDLDEVKKDIKKNSYKFLQALKIL
ncbi:MAG: TatD family hydrolase [Ignisphaera sp.]